MNSFQESYNNSESNSMSMEYRTGAGVNTYVKEDGKAHRRVEDLYVSRRMFLCCLSGHMITIKGDMQLPTKIIPADEQNYENCLVLTSCIRCDDKSRYSPINVAIIKNSDIHNACQQICGGPVKILHVSGYTKYIDINTIISSLTKDCEINDIQYNTEDSPVHTKMLGYARPGFLF